MPEIPIRMGSFTAVGAAVGRVVGCAGALVGGTAAVGTGVAAGAHAVARRAPTSIATTNFIIVLDIVTPPYD